MSQYAGARERVILVSGNFRLMTPDRTMWPQINVSPRTSSGLPTASLGIVLFTNVLAPGPAVPVAPGMTLQIWRVAPTLGAWAALAPITGVAFGQQLVLPDIGGGWGLYASVTNLTDPNGYVYAGIAELP